MDKSVFLILDNYYKSISDPCLTLPSQNNVFLIDWLTCVCFGESVDYIKWLLGLESPSIPWEETEKFINGYPVRCHWNGITIMYGADDEKYYKDPSKVRYDMGICVNLSGTGCRTFESYGHGDWFRLFNYLLRNTDNIARDQRVFKRYNITRLDLSYDDHIGLLDIYRIEQDTRDRYYTSRSTYSEIVWSDNLDTDIQGLNIQVGSDKSDIKIRIYDKAAERGFNDRHWIRVELQLRDERSFNAVKALLDTRHIGRVTSGILRNYLLYRIPSMDSNKSRWLIADYWDMLLLDMERISLWISPGESYNFSNTEHWLVKQYGQAIVVLDKLHDDFYLVDRCKQLYPDDKLSPKYKRLLSELDPKKPFDLTSDFPEVESIFKEDLTDE